jgi:hypothetical protein
LEAGEPLPEDALEMDIADVARVVITGHHQLGGRDLIEPSRGLLELPLVACGGQVARHDHHVRPQPVDPLDGGLHHVLTKAGLTAVDVRELSDA